MNIAFIERDTKDWPHFLWSHCIPIIEKVNKLDPPAFLRFRSPSFTGFEVCNAVGAQKDCIIGVCIEAIIWISEKLDVRREVDVRCPTCYRNKRDILRDQSTTKIYDT